ncbi:Replication protein A 70 kDa DNA-binding subunit B [Rhynchospora pubera]|uniref:Replication protein A 70 kDa DNA-binding subunit B n=1 Tax=Rhynchospora pubera TaxID=906938 RepID=A0AAV8G389_9POAL|nr:Replication protein A 70 kDa DNA-binding subunit B [Rhynchospora pubera]
MDPPVRVSTLTVTTNTQRARIHARPVRIWPASDPRRGRVWRYSFLLLDHTGDQIQGFISTPDYQRISAIFAEHNIVEITKFRVDGSTKDYQVVDREYAVNITRLSQIRTLPSNMYQIPTYCFDFKQLEDVGVNITYEKAVLDTIARLSGFSEIRTVPALGHARVQTMYLTNERGYSMDVALWGDFIDMFNVPQLYEQSKSAPIIIACNAHSSLIKYHQMQRSTLYSLKTYTGTRFHFDTAIKEISNYLAQTPFDGHPIVLQATHDMFGRDPRVLSPLPKVNPVMITLAGLNNLYLDNFTEGLYQCPARIVHIIDPFDWHYQACPDCRRKLEYSNHELHCPDCHVRKRQFIPWYRIRVQVKDATDEAQFMLLGKTGEMIVGVDSVTLKMEEDKNNEKIPQALLDIVNKTYLFTVSGKQPGPYRKHRSYTVTRHEKVPDTMLHLLPPPVLLLQEPSPHQQAATPITPQTPSVQQDNQNTTVPGSSQNLPDEQALPTKRIEPQDTPAATIPLRAVRRRLQDDFSSSSQENSTSSQPVQDGQQQDE